MSQIASTALPPGPRLPKWLQTIIFMRYWPRFVTACRRRYGKVFTIRAWQDGKPLAVEINYDKVIWSGLSWAVGEIGHASLRPGLPVTIECSSAEESPVRLEGHVYQVEY